MFKITNDTIEITRGDKVGFDFKIDNYTFQIGDVISFRVYERKGLDKTPLIDKDTTVEIESDSVNITLSSEETRIGDMVNKEVTYWYEIELNGNQTVIGYDEDGAKEFILYPEGAE